MDLGDTFVLTQDDIRGGESSARPGVKQRRQPATTDSMTPPVQPRARSAVTRSATSVAAPDSRPKSLVPLFTASDSASASTWLDDVKHQSDDERRHEPTRPTGARRPYEDTAAEPRTRQLDSPQRDSYDFHFALAASASASSSSSSSSSQQQQPAAVSRPVALVQPHKVTGVRVMPNELNSSLLARSQAKPAKPTPTATPAAALSRQAPSTDAALQQDAGRSKYREERGGSGAAAAAPSAAISLRDQLKAASSASARDSSPTTQAPSKLYDFNNAVQPGPAPSTSSSSSASAIARAISEHPVNSGAEMTSKEKEIASAMGNMRLDYASSQNTLSAHGTNFEKCLGYFP